LTSEGQSPAALSEVIVLPWNDPGALEDIVRKHHGEIAAIITEPILCNSSCLMPQPGYLELMRKLTNHYGLVLIFDEVITGFRVAAGGAQELFGVIPDLATFGKAVAGGFTLSVIAGKKRIMDLIPRGRVIHAGTFNGNPIALCAAQATLKCLNRQNHSALGRIRSIGEMLMKEIIQTAEEFRIPVLINGVGAAFHVSFTKRREMLNYRDTLDCDPRVRDDFLRAMLESGVYLLPDGRWYVSAAHSDSDAHFTLQAVRKSFGKLKVN
jgi:glutamate-1-semialdehyde 2,1-aminomutase